jgi:hypothetical protein
MHNYSVDNFIGIFPNAIPYSLCDSVVEYFKKVQDLGLTKNRKQSDGAPSIMKDSESYLLSNTHGLIDYDNEIIANTDSGIFEVFSQSVWDCYQLYVEKYGVLESISKHGISPTVKIQKSSPGSGYHVWHCENDTFFRGNRILLVILYLNDVTEGGETEFLYQSIRVKPKKGTLLFCPSGYTHTHRGNPPLSGDKYIITSWIEFYL